MKTVHFATASPTTPSNSNSNSRSHAIADGTGGSSTFSAEEEVGSFSSPTQSLVQGMGHQRSDTGESLSTPSTVGASQADLGSPTTGLTSGTTAGGTERSRGATAIPVSSPVDTSGGTVVFPSVLRGTVNFLRKQLFIVLLLSIVVGIISAFAVPLFAVLLLPTAAMAAYWVADPRRFGNGGDLRQCFNRDCTLLLYHIVAVTLILVSCYDIVVNGFELLSHSETSQTHKKGLVKHTTGYHDRIILLDVVVLFTSVYGVVTVTRLRGMLQPVLAETSAMETDY